MENNSNEVNSVPEYELGHKPLQKTEKKALKIPIKTAIIIAIIIVVGVFAYIYKGLFVVATVDGSPISRLSIISRLEKASGKNLLDSLITEKLIRSEASAKGISISDDEVNEEIKKVEEQIKTRGGTLEEALAGQGMSLDDLKNQIKLQKEMEKLVADKINVTDEEVEQYIKDNKITIPAGQEAQTRDGIKSELRNQKLNKEAVALISDLKSQAKIRYFVNY